MRWDGCTLTLLWRKECPGRNQEEGTAHDKCGTSNLEAANKPCGYCQCGKKDLQKAGKALQQYYNPKSTKVVQHYTFNTRIQNPGESVATSHCWVSLMKRSWCQLKLQRESSAGFLLLLALSTPWATRSPQLIPMQMPWVACTGCSD